ncbi:MAG: hypothetical protein GY797_08965 [Deltaproteobacteria bacterium]|nr:hypothetical protein [Deltaproteobacteria bacterium]
MEKDPYLKKFYKCIEALNKVFIENTFDYIEKNHPDMWTKMLEHETGINDTWDISMKAFETHLVAFYRLNLRMIKLCKTNS